MFKPKKEKKKTVKEVKKKEDVKKIVEEKKKKEIIEKKKPEKVEVKKIENDDLIKVMNYTAGRLIYINPRTQQQWTFDGYGAIDHMSFSELQTIKSVYPKFLFEPWLVILNDEAVSQLGISDFYNKILQPKEIDKFFNMSEYEMEAFLNNAPNNMKKLIIDITKDKIKKKTFGDLFKIKHIESVLKCKLLD